MLDSEGVVVDRDGSYLVTEETVPAIASTRIDSVINTAAVGIEAAWSLWCRSHWPWPFWPPATARRTT